MMLLWQLDSGRRLRRIVIVRVNGGAVVGTSCESRTSLKPHPKTTYLQISLRTGWGDNREALVLIEQLEQATYSERENGWYNCPSG
jgi:hypothetical protein